MICIIFVGIQFDTFMELIGEGRNMIQELRGCYIFFVDSILGLALIFIHDFRLAFCVRITLGSIYIS